jgi:copper chaperone CopZ
MRTQQWTTFGSLVSAAASSACCWLPLIMVATGVSAVGLSGFFEQYRPVFLVVAAAFLGVGFYLNYRPQKQSCHADGSCETSSPRLRRWNLGMLWVSTALVAALAMFPHYVGSLFGTDAATANEVQSAQLLTLDIDGMTCAGCEIGIEAALGELPQIETVDADFESGTAKVRLLPGQRPTKLALESAVAKAGYTISKITDRE